MALTVRFSNHVEKLRDQLVLDMAIPLIDPLAPEWVLVDNRVLGEWINMQLAQQRGIAANIRYIQPHELFWSVARALVSQDIPKATPLSKEEMTWKLYGLLADEALLNTAAMAAVKNYLAGEQSKALKRYQLAASIADLFDQYLIYRPDWMLAWENLQPPSHHEPEHGWQKILWQLLAASSAEKKSQGVHHRALIEQRLLQTLQQAKPVDVCAALPIQRLFVFGISSMPENLLQLLVGLGRYIEVTAYIINPCREYWSLIQSARALAAKEAPDTYIADEYYEVGNPLLASQGVQVRDFIALLQQYSDVVVESDAFDESAVADTLLQSIQHEIRDLTYKGEIARSDYVTAGQPLALPDGDGNTAECIPSIHIHECHSRMREVEVLHEQLRHIMQKNPDILPRDIVVMMPQVAPYTPYIHAVFNSVEEKFCIPFHVTDRTVLEESPLLNSIETLLRLPGSRLPLSDIVSLLEVPAIQRRFGMDQPAYETIKRWLVESGARWGVDGAHRVATGLPAYNDFSWQFGFDRMFSGYAMQVEAENPAAAVLTLDDLPVLPYDDIEGSATEHFDAFLHFWQALLFWRTTLSQDASAGEWATRLRNLLADFYQPDAEKEQQALKAVYSGIKVLDDTERNAWHSGKLPLSVIQAVIKPVMKQPSTGQHHWREGVKFCSLMPMRGVPFKVVYVLGMTLDDYPRRVDRKSFDLMRKHYRAGDRASRIDDRWLFLEALLSARRYFHVSYIGRDIHRNEKREPSVVLSELLDYCRHGYRLPEHYLRTEHPLQPFGDVYFRQDKQDHSPQLVSFNQQACLIANARREQGNAPVDGEQRWAASDAVVQKNNAQENNAPAITTVAITTMAITTVAIDDFVQFFTTPWNWFLGKKHKVWLNIAEDTVEDEELYTIGDGLANWQLRSDLIQLVNAAAGDADDRESRRDELVEQLALLRRAEGRWPVGIAGQQAITKLRQEKTDYLWASHGKVQTPQTITVYVDARGGALNLHGELSLFDGDSFLLHSASKHGDGKVLDFQLRLAIALAGLPEGSISHIQAVYRDKILAPNADLLTAATAQSLLQTLATLYLQYQHSGLPFDPTLGKKLFELGDDPDAEAEEMIENAWYENSEWNTGMAYDLKRRTYFWHVNALQTKTFHQVSHTVWQAVNSWYEPASSAGKKGEK